MGGKRILIFVRMTYSELHGTKQANDLNRSPKRETELKTKNNFVDGVWQVFTRESKLPAHLSSRYTATKTT